MNNIDKQKLINAVLSSGKIDSKSVNDAISKNDASEILSTLPPEERQKLMSVLSDKSALSSVLNSKEAKAILSSFLKGGK